MWCARAIVKIKACSQNAFDSRTAPPRWGSQSKYWPLHRPNGATRRPSRAASFRQKFPSPAAQTNTLWYFSSVLRAPMKHSHFRVTWEKKLRHIRCLDLKIWLLMHHTCGEDRGSSQKTSKETQSGNCSRCWCKKWLYTVEAKSNAKRCRITNKLFLLLVCAT